MNLEYLGSPVIGTAEDNRATRAIMQATRASVSREI